MSNASSKNLAAFSGSGTMSAMWRSLAMISVLREPLDAAKDSEEPRLTTRRTACYRGRPNTAGGLECTRICANSSSLSTSLGRGGASRARVPASGSGPSTGGGRSDGPALLFDAIKGFPRGFRIFTNATTSPQRAALALGIDPKLRPLDALKAWMEKRKTLQPRAPVVVKDAAFLQHAIKGKDV